MPATPNDLWVTVRVRPGSRVSGVGGEHDGALVVRVHQRAVDGKATEEALTAIATALGVRRRGVRLVRGASSRQKVIGIDVAAAQPMTLPELQQRLIALRRQPSDG